MKCYLLQLFVLFMVFTLHAQDITEIDLTQAKFVEVPANRIFDEIKFVPLETHKDGLLSMRSTFYLTDKYIIAVKFLTGAYLFDRKTGAFIREISSFGQGPDEYKAYIYPDYGFDEKNNILFATDWISSEISYKGINIETNKVESAIKISVSKENTEEFVPTSPWRINDDMYISFCNNRTGKDKVRLVVFNKDGEIIKKHPNYLEYINGGGISMPNNSGIFYDYKGLTYFKEWGYNDTIFCVDEKKMSPHIIFKLGEKQASYYHQKDLESSKGKYLIRFVHESNSFVLFNFSYFTEIMSASGMSNPKASTHTGYYDKKSKQVFISSTPDFKKSGYSVNGLPISFYPIYISKNNEMVSIIDPEELTKNKDKIDSKYRHLLQDIQEDDNPILIIAKIKD